MKSMSPKCLCQVMMHMCEYPESARELDIWFDENPVAPEKPDLELRDYEERLMDLIDELAEHISVKEALWNCINAFHKSYFSEDEKVLDTPY